LLIDAQTLALFIPTVLVLVLSPGPDMVFITANSLSSGKRGGVFSALGCTSGAFTHAVLAAFGLTAIVAAWQPAYKAVCIGGALYLAYLGVKMLLAKQSPLSIQSAGGRKSGWRLYREGYINNIMNPKAILFSLTFLPQFANPARGPIRSSCSVSCSRQSCLPSRFQSRSPVVTSASGSHRVRAPASH
jgi:threonine/homoserine/homoserine lactone efflux protein